MRWGRATENRTGQHALMTYGKGPWVVHVLRNPRLDFRTMSDERLSRMRTCPPTSRWTSR